MHTFYTTEWKLVLGIYLIFLITQLLNKLSKNSKKNKQVFLIYSAALFTDIFLQFC